jgi:hypothetical protein
MRGAIPALPQHVFIAWFLVAQGQLYLYLYLTSELLRTSILQQTAHEIGCTGQVRIAPTK